MRFIIRRLLQAVLVMLSVAFVAFLLFQYVGDPVAQMVGQDATAAARTALNDVLGAIKEGNYTKALPLAERAVELAETAGDRKILATALTELGPCPEHRYSFINVRRVATRSGARMVAECKPDPPAERDGYR